jgi:hypothetical protein
VRWRAREATSLPLVRFCRTDEPNNDPTNWFVPTIRALLDWCSSRGLEPELMAAWPEDGRARAMVRASPLPDFLSIAVSPARCLSSHDVSPGKIIGGLAGPAPSGSSAEEQPTATCPGWIRTIRFWQTRDAGFRECAQSSRHSASSKVSCARMCEKSSLVDCVCDRQPRSHGTDAFLNDSWLPTSWSSS